MTYDHWKTTEPEPFEDEPDVGERETEADAWEYWHQRARQFEEENAQLRAFIKELKVLVVDGTKEIERLRVEAMKREEAE